MGRKLKVTVYLDNAVEEGGQPRALLAGTEPSSEDAARISNPDVWEEQEEQAALPVPTAPATARGARARASTAEA